MHAAKKQRAWTVSDEQRGPLSRPRCGRRDGTSCRISGGRVLVQAQISLYIIAEDVPLRVESRICEC